MKTKNTLKKITLFVSGIAVFTLSSAYAADNGNNLSDETVIAKTEATANPDALCPNGNSRGTRADDCTAAQKGRRGNVAKGQGNKGRQGNFANEQGNKGRQGNFAKGHGHGGRGNMARAGGRQGNSQGRRGMGPGKGQGKGQGAHDGSCVQAPADATNS